MRTDREMVGADEDKAGRQMCERDGAAKGRYKVREAERGERQAWEPHKDGQGTWMKHQTTKMGTWDGRKERVQGKDEKQACGLGSTWP